MSLLNLFGSDSSDSIQSSRFAANLKKETYDPLLLTFNSIRTGKKKDAVSKNANKDVQSNQSATLIDVFSQKMILAKSFDSLDAAQRQTQTESSCDHIVLVPTSFEIKKDTMNAFYESKFKQFFERKTDVNNNAAANIFMNWSMFESFVNFSNLNAHKRQIKLIETSHDAAKKEVGRLTSATTKVIDFTTNNAPIRIGLEELYAIVYTTPTDPASDYLPLADVFAAGGRLQNVISQKMLTYFSNYFQALVLHNTSSVGRIPKYLPLLNSNLTSTNGATPVMTDGPRAAPSRNVEVMSDFLIGIMTNKRLSNRSELRSDKLKAIRDKTYLCTFKSTTEYSLNYDILLKRLYYKYPCFLTPSLNMSSDTIEKMKENVIHNGLAMGADFENLLEHAVSECNKINACNLIYAVAVASQVFILIQVEWDDQDDALRDLTNVRIGLSATVSAGLNGLIIAGKVQVQPTQLNPLIGAACAVAHSVLAAATHQATIAQPNSRTIRQDAINAMNQVMNSQSNFASFMYDNTTLLSAMEYSDQPPVHVNIKHADYLKTFYAAKDDAVKSEQDEFNQISDEMLYVIHGPVYFDYECIFRQDPSLIKHILGEEVPPESTTTAAKEQSQWIPRVDPLTENVHYINRNPTNPNYPKMRFDNPTIPLPRNVEPRRDYADDRQYTKIWKELYVSPEQARDEKASVQENVANALHMMTAIEGLDALFATWNGYTTAANNVTKHPDVIDAMYNWMTPGYYRYELTVTVPNQAAIGEQLTNRFVQLMRPVETGTVQDYTEPNLPTAYPPPLMFITPPMRGPTNSFMLHTWIPDLSSELSPSYRAFMTGEPNGKKSLNRGAYMEHLYKMMQLIFKTVMLNAKTAGLTSASSSSAETKRICVKIMAIGYSSNERNLKMVSDDDDRKFIGDSFFYAVRDYSMFYEVNNVNVIVYYNESTQQDVRQRYNEYTGQRESVLLRMGSSTSQATTIDANLKLKIMPVDDFFTLKFPIGKLQLQEKDLLYFVNYCSTPRAFIGNCGEWPENIEDVVNDAIIGYNATSPQNLLASLADAKIEIDLLYGSREIDAKMTQITQNLTQWNDAKTTKPKELVSAQEKIRDKYVNYKMNGNVVAASNANNKPMNVNVSWWKGHNADADNALPRNAYLSSFDEHVLILKNLLTPFAVDNFVRLMFDTNENATKNCGPYTTDVNQTAATFENAVYAYAQAKKIMTLLSKIKPDDIQISSDNIERVKKALAHLTVDMSWSMDAKFTTGTCDGAFIPNSSVLHNPFICTQLLDINKWQYVDFDDIASREIPETKPLPPLLKKIVDLKIQESLGASVSAESSAVNSSILIVSKQPSIARLMKNVKTIFENLFQKNAPLKIDGKEMVLNNYAWPEEQLYCKMRNDTKLASFKRGGSQTAIDFAELRGLRSSSARKCIEFPLFVVQLTFTLFEGKLSDITLLDQASLTCSSDKAMMDSNLKIVWEQMMTNLKAKEQNFTIANVFKRLGFNSVNAEYDYTSYFDADPGAVGLLDATQTNGTATILIACTDVATNPILRTTNSKKLEKINEEVSDTALTENAKFYNTPPCDPSSVAVLPSINPIGPYNSIRALAKIAEYFNLVEMHGVAGIPIDPTKSTEITRKLADLSTNYVPKNITNSGARIGWNAAIQTDSTMLYVNPNVMVNGTLQDISGYLLTLKPGDKILIQIDTGNVEHGKAFIYAAGRILRRKGLRFATYMKIKLLNGIYRVMNGITLLLGVVFRALELGGKALWLIFKCILNCVKYATTVVASAGLAAMGIPLAIAWLPVTLIVAILRGLIWIKKRSIVRGITYIGRTIKKRFAGDDAGDDAGDELDQMDEVIRKMKSQGAGDDEDMQELDQMEGAVEELENVDASGADMSGLDDETENEAVGYTLDIWRKDSKSVGSDFINLVKKVWGKKNKPLVKVNVDFQPSDTLKSVLKNLRAPQEYIESKSVASTQKFKDDKIQYNSDTTADETLAKEAFKQAFGKSQMWMITEPPTRNLSKGLSDNVINIPVYHFRLRTSNLINPFGQEIPNDTKLKVEFQKFSKDD